MPQGYGPTPKVSFNISLTEPEHAALQTAAAARGETKTGFARRVILQQIDVLLPKQKEHRKPWETMDSD